MSGCVSAVSFLLCVAGLLPAVAQEKRLASSPSNFAGVYRVIANSTRLPGGLKNSGSPSEVPMLPKAAEQAKSVNLKEDPWRTCQPVGQFRLMAREGTVIEFAPVTGMFVILDEDVAHGLFRPVYLNRGHLTGAIVAADPAIAATNGTWFGDSVGHMEGDTLVIDTTRFNTRTWLNDAGARHSEDMRQVERIRPVLGGRFLEYKMTVEDPAILSKPYTYTRYMEKLDREIAEDICQDAE